MVAMDFFAALNCYDFLNQYCSNLLKNPTVRGLIGSLVLLSYMSLTISHKPTRAMNVIVSQPGSASN